jgi:tetratricopeptide (TPR) repeat protein
MPCAAPPVLEGPLVGRAEEYASLVTLYHAARHGAGQAVAILGEPGIGKTRLANDFADWAVADGADILRARALEIGGRLAYQPLVWALRARLERENAPEDLLSDVWLAELSRLLPELRERYPDLSPSVVEEATAQPRLFEAIARLGESLARNRPVLLLIDDLQWADATSRDVLQYAAGRWVEGGLPVLLLLTLRAPSGVAAPRMDEWLTSLARSMPVTRLALGPLSAHDTHDLLSSMVKSAVGERDATAGGGQAEAVSRWLFDETGGQPFFLLETLRALVERDVLALRRRADGTWALAMAGNVGDVQHLSGFLPPSVRAIIRGRLAPLTPAAVALVGAGAVLGQGFPFDLLCEVAGFGELEGLSALDAVLASGLLREVAGEPGQPQEHRYFFSHDRIRDTVYEEVGAARRQVLHRRALAVLEARAAPAADKAHHARSAGLYPVAVGYSTAAGDDALALFAVRDAISHYEQARQLLPRALSGASAAGGVRLQHLYVQLGRAYELAGETDAAHTIYQEMLATARQTTHPAMECEALNHLATLAAQAQADLVAARSLLGQALQVAEISGDRVARAETAWNLAQLGIYAWTPGPAMADGARALEFALEISHAELIARCLNVIASAEVLAGHWHDAEGHAQDASRRYAQLGDRVIAADCICLAAHAQLKLGRPRDACETAQAAATISREIYNAWGQINSAHHLALALLDLDRATEALDVAQAGMEAAGSTGVPLMRVLAEVAMGAVRRALGAPDEARAIHQNAMGIVEVMGAPPFLTDFVASELCADCAKIGDWSAALVYAQQAPAARDGTFLAGGLARWYETEALLRGGLADAAQADVARFGELIPERGRHRIEYLRAQAVLAFWTGAPDHAADYLRAARALASEMGVPGEIGSIDRALAQMGGAPGELDAAQ